MGWVVLSMGNIDFKEKIEVKVINRVKSILKETEEDYFNFKSGRDWIAFTLQGNKGIDYKCLDKIKKEFKEKIETITFNEFSEVGDGYYYEEVGE